MRKGQSVSELGSGEKGADHVCVRAREIRKAGKEGKGEGGTCLSIPDPRDKRAEGRRRLSQGEGAFGNGAVDFLGKPRKRSDALQQPESYSC